ncbi:MAG: hypothetical protein P4L80_09555 [Xanthobacteraceae bacterium]|nr:hypothetical protein [Xanthobacteraceae bacterium]
MDARQEFFDFFRRQVPQKIGFRQELDPRFRGMLLARQREFPELRGVTNGRAFAFQEK